MSLPPDLEAAFRAAGEAAARAEELRLQAQWLIATAAAAPSLPVAADDGRPWTKRELAARHKKHPSWVDRCVARGMPHSWAGSSKRFTEASEAWIALQGRFAAKAPADDAIDVSAALRAGGLRAVAGGR